MYLNKFRTTRIKLKCAFMYEHLTTGRVDQRSHDTSAGTTIPVWVNQTFQRSPKLGCRHPPHGSRNGISRSWRMHNVIGTCPTPLPITNINGRKEQAGRFHDRARGVPDHKLGMLKESPVR
jgi:hypothetical protein